MFRFSYCQIGQKCCASFMVFHIKIVHMHLCIYARIVHTAHCTMCMRLHILLLFTSLFLLFALSSLKKILLHVTAINGAYWTRRTCMVLCNMKSCKRDKFEHPTQLPTGEANETKWIARMNGGPKKWERAGMRQWARWKERGRERERERQREWKWEWQQGEKTKIKATTKRNGN